MVNGRSQSSQDVYKRQEGCGAFETSFLKRLAEQISRSVYELDSDNRKYLHLSAVFGMINLQI